MQELIVTLEQKIDLSDIQTIDELEIYIKDAIEEIELLKESLNNE